ncbi:MAG: hypothetical protein AAGF75_12225, partial [Cyanobacteria bacterium P01_H01_bin.130]
GNEIQLIDVDGVGTNDRGLAARYVIRNDVNNSPNPFPGITPLTLTGLTDPLVDGFHDQSASGDLAFDPATGSLFIALRTSDDPVAISPPLPFTVTGPNLTDATLGEQGTIESTLDDIGDGRAVSELYRIDPVGGSGTLASGVVNATSTLTRVTDLTPIEVQATLIGTLPVSAGGLAFGPDGGLYVTGDNSIVQVNKLTAATIGVPITTQLADGTVVSIGDLATLPTETPQIDLNLTKSSANTEATPGSTIEYDIIVAHTGGDNDIEPPFPVTVTDAPDLSRVENVRWRVESFSGAGATPTAGLPNTSANLTIGGTFETGAFEDIEIRSLAIGQSLIFRVLADVRADAVSGPLTNTVSATLPEGIQDPNLPPLERTLTATETDQVIVPDTNSPPQNQNRELALTGAQTDLDLNALNVTQDPDGDPIAFFTITKLPTSGQLTA